MCEISARKNSIQECRGADQCQVGKRLRKIPEVASISAQLFRVEPEMVGVSQKLLEQ